jgi:glucose-6-phosphate 1-dehydrogenase
MSGDNMTANLFPAELSVSERTADPCIMVIFGASGDLTRRLLIPALYNLASDGLLADNFVIVAMARRDYTTQSFRGMLSENIKQFATRKDIDEETWQRLIRQLYYLRGSIDDPTAYTTLADTVNRLDSRYNTRGNILFYLATPPAMFSTITTNLYHAGLNQADSGWRRIIIEKPFGHDLQSALTLNRELLACWDEDQIYRIDHYLGKETVQNILAFRFSNRIFEPLWSRNFVDHIQLTVTERVGVGTRGAYYDQSGVLRDMIQNHMFQMLSYICMEPPTSFRANAIRHEKAKLLEAVRIMQPDEVTRNTIRGQYGVGHSADGSKRSAYREEADVNPTSVTETFAAMKLHIDNWRWEGVPIYLRSGKNLWKKETTILVQFKRAPEIIFRDTPAANHIDANQLVFHIQPEEGIELRFQAKRPGPTVSLQKVNMRFNYGESFQNTPGTGYETLIYDTMIGDASLFSRSDLVETAWRIAQPVLDTWAANPPEDFPNYAAGSWGPKSAFDLIAQDGRKWLELVNCATLEKVPLFQPCRTVFLSSLMMMLKPAVYAAGENIVIKGDTGREMYFINRGEVETIDANGDVIRTLQDGDFFGEIALLLSRPRTATVRAKTDCDMFVLEQTDFRRILSDFPEFAHSVLQVARDRYQITAPAEELFDTGVTRYLKDRDAAPV